MRQTKLNCPVCDRSEIRYRSRADDYVCRHCGAVFTIVRDAKGATFYVSYSPTTRAQKFTVRRKWGE